MRTTLDQGQEKSDEVSRSRGQEQGLPEDVGHQPRTSRMKQFQQSCGKTPGCTPCRLDQPSRQHSAECKRRQQQWDEETKRNLRQRVEQEGKPLTRTVPMETKQEQQETFHRRISRKTSPSQIQSQKRPADVDIEDLRDNSISNVTIKGPPWFETATGVQLKDELVEKGMNRERKDFIDFDVYDEVPVEDYSRAQQEGLSPELVGSGWVLARKPDNSVRARCVATQVNYGTEMSTFAATPTVVGLRILLLRALQRGWKVRTADISVAFLHSKIPSDQHIFVRPPATEDSKHGYAKGKFFWTLKRALYGLRQAPKFFQECLAEVLQELHWTRLKSEPQLWVHDQRQGALLLAHVDDLLVTANEKDLKDIQDEINEKFRTKWGDFIDEKWTRYLGLEWRRHKHGNSRCFEV